MVSFEIQLQVLQLHSSSVALAILGPLHCPTYLRINLSISMKEATGTWKGYLKIRKVSLETVQPMDTGYFSVPLSRHPFPQ